METTSSASERNKTLDDRAVRAVVLCVLSVFDWIKRSLPERAVRALLRCARSVFDRKKRNLADQAVRTPLLCVRSEPDWIHQASTGCNDVRRTQEGKEQHGELKARVHAKDAVDYTSFLHPRLRDLPWEPRRTRSKIFVRRSRAW